MAAGTQSGTWRGVPSMSGSSKPAQIRCAQRPSEGVKRAAHSGSADDALGPVRSPIRPVCRHRQAARYGAAMLQVQLLVREFYCQRIHQRRHAAFRAQRWHPSVARPSKWRMGVVADCSNTIKPASCWRKVRTPKPWMTSSSCGCMSGQYQGSQGRSEPLPPTRPTGGHPVVTGLPAQRNRGCPAAEEDRRRKGHSGPRRR